MVEVWREGIVLNKPAVREASMGVLALFREVFPYIDKGQWQTFTDRVDISIEGSDDPFMSQAVKGAVLRSYEFSLAFWPTRYSGQPYRVGGLEIWTCLPPALTFEVNSWVNYGSYGALQVVL